MNGGSFTDHDSSDVSSPEATPIDSPATRLGASGHCSADEEVADDDAGERDHRARREIDAAGNDHDRRADRGDAVDRRVLQDQQRVLDVEERMRAAGFRPQIPGEEQHFGDQDRDGARARERAQHSLHAASRCQLQCVARRMTSSSVAAAPLELALQLALAHHEDAIGEREHLRQIARDDEHGEAGAACCRIISWISNFAPTSTPLVGSSSSSTRGLVAIHLATTTFCWLPPLSESGRASMPAALIRHRRSAAPPRGVLARLDQHVVLRACARKHAGCGGDRG